MREALVTLILSFLTATSAAAAGVAPEAPPAPEPFDAIARAETLRRQGRPADARRVLEEMRAGCALAADEVCRAVVEVGHAEVLLLTGEVGPAEAACALALGRLGPTPPLRALAAVRSCMAEVAIQSGLVEAAAAPARAAIAAADRVGDARIAGRATIRLAQALRKQGGLEEARRLLTPLLAARGIDPAVAGDARRELAYALNLGGQPTRALELLEEALRDARDVGDRFGEGMSLYRSGSTLKDVGEGPRSVERLRAALALWRELGNAWGEAQILMVLAHQERRVGDFAHALADYERAVAAFRENGHRYALASALGGLAQTRAELGEAERSLATFRESLAVYEEVGDRLSYARILSDMADRQRASGLLAEALASYQRAAPIQREVGDRMGEGHTLGGLGAVQAARGELADAERNLEASVELEHGVRDRMGEAEALRNLGLVLIARGRSADGLALLQQSIPVHRAAGDRPGEARSLAELARALRQSALPRAIFHAKQAVNLLQGLRGDLRGVGAETEQAYTRQVSAAYRLLADLLLDGNRVLEAQEVMDLLKTDEVNRLLRRISPVGRTVPFVGPELAADRKYRELTERLVEATVRLDALRGGKAPTPDQEREAAALRGVVAQRTMELDAFMSGFSSGLAVAEAQRDRLGRAFGGDVRRVLREYPGKAVAVYTIFGTDQVRLVVNRGDGALPVTRSVSLPAGEVSRRVFALRQALANPGTPDDALRAASGAVWEVLIAPIDADLESAGATTVLWSLDGPLRYVPIAGLYDGKRARWFVQDRASFVITGAAGLSTRSPAKLTALAAGVTLGFPPLPPLVNVRAELEAVVRSRTSARGALHGTVLADADFTRARFLDTLMGGASVVHVASHYVFSATPDAGGSYLLLGDGDRLTLRELDEQPTDLFAKVRLLTLSACDTALGAESNGLAGAEVDGLAMVARQKGAAAVLATLWPVNDPATAAFMSDFYRRLAGRRGAIAELVRQAQLDMMEGRLLNEGRPVKSPAYWAPFVLLGDGF